MRNFNLLYFIVILPFTLNLSFHILSTSVQSCSLVFFSSSLPTFLSKVYLFNVLDVYLTHPYFAPTEFVLVPYNPYACATACTATHFQKTLALDPRNLSITKMSVIIYFDWWKRNNKLFTQRGMLILCTRNPDIWHAEPRRKYTIVVHPTSDYFSRESFRLN